MKAVILAAGIASRLRPLTDHTPKCLLKVGSKSLLERTIDAILANDINEIVIVTGYREEMIRDFVSRTYPQVKVEYIYNDVYASTNNIYSLWLAKDAVKGSDMLLMDSDILFESPMITALLDAPYPNCLAMNSHELGEEEMKVVVDDAMKILEISKTCAVKDAKGESIGIEKFSKAFVQEVFDELDHMILQNKQVDIFYEAAFQNLIERGSEIYVVDATHYFSMELDTVEDFETAVANLPDHLK